MEVPKTEERFITINHSNIFQRLRLKFFINYFNMTWMGAGLSRPAIDLYHNME